jgi:photosynthesis system II assembly factor YCF48-like protein/putative zinc finger protein
MTDPRNPSGDRGLEQLLRETLRPPDAGGVACLDADTLAAWVDDALTPGERAAAEAHAAGCARCQSMLAVMIRTAPVDAVAEGSAVRRWAMMFVPALAAAAAVTLWFAVERPWRSGAPAPAAAQEARSAVGEPPVLPAPATAAPASPADAPMTHAAKKEAELMLADALRKNTAGEERAPSSESALRRAPEEKSIDKDRRRAAAGTVADARAANVAAPAARRAPGAATPPPPAAAPLGGLAETVAIQPPAAPTRADDRVRQAPPMQSATQYPQQQSSQQLPTQQQAPPPQQQATPQQGTQQRPDQQQAGDVVTREAAAPRPRAETDSARAAAAGRGGAAEAVQVNALRSGIEKSAGGAAFRSPDGSGWWRISGGRVAEASTDKGATWSPRYVADDKTVLTAGAAATTSTVWIVGRAGVVLVTTNGHSWRRLPFPENTDLIAVTAADARHATVIAADGRAFATADAGATWSRK